MTDSNAQPGEKFLADAFAQASTPALMMSMIHMTGDIGLLEGFVRPRRPPMLEMQGKLCAEDQAHVRNQAIEVTREFFRSGASAQLDLADATVKKMLAFTVGLDDMEPLYERVMSAELDLGGTDPKRVEIDPEAVQRSDINVVIIGAGMSGILLAIRLKQAGIPYTVLEKNSEVGGTWYENRYPGCRVDIASHAYSFSSEHEHDWQHFFGQQPELRQYFNTVAKRRDILQSIEFAATVASACFDEQAGNWKVSYEKAGQQHELRSSVVISAVGQLNQPNLPAVEGRERFKGEQMHTARWPENLDYTGKRVAVVGSGATAFQMTPELAKTAEHVTVFQRTPQWMLPNPGYHDQVTEGHQWCFENLPGYARWFRFLSLWPMTDTGGKRIKVHADWDDGGLSCGPDNKKMRDILTAYIESQVDDPELLEKVVPQYPPFGTRLLQDNGSWLTTLQKDNVSLIAESVAEVSETGLISADGQEVEADIIAWATGFKTDRFVWPLEVQGIDQQRLDDVWQPIPKAYLGITVPGFPNFFCLYGPNTNVAHTTNCIFIAECQVRYIMQSLKLLIEQNHQRLECKSDVAEEYEQRLSAALDETVWAYHNVKGFYRLDSGRVVVNMPWNAADYWQWTSEINADDYIVS